MAAYAPLLVNANFRIWPTNLIVFDNHRCGIARHTPGWGLRNSLPPALHDPAALIGL